ncbi:MAG: hypothetical protein ACRER4_03680 [Steroidobacteraceae bacterium]
MIKSILVTATLAALLAGPAFADDKGKRGGDDHSRGEFQTYRHDDWRGDDHHYNDRHYPGYDHRWRHIPPFYYRSNNGYRAGYEYGWRDASRYCRFDYRPGRWYRDPRDSYWYFGFQIDG